MSTEAVVNELFDMYERVLAEHDLKDRSDRVICLKDKSVVFVCKTLLNLYLHFAF